MSLSLGTPTYITVHQDVSGMIAKVTDVFSNLNINIGTMTVTRASKGEKAIMIIEVDERRQRDEILQKLRALPNVDSATYFE
jgi:L-serine deaminase